MILLLSPTHFIYFGVLSASSLSLSVLCPFLLAWAMIIYAQQQHSTMSVMVTRHSE